MLTRDLADRDPSLAQDHVHGVELLRSRPEKNQDITSRQLETKITFSPMGLTKLLRPMPVGTEYKFLMVAEDNLYQSTHRVECEIPTYLLRKVLPPVLFAPPVKAYKSRTPKRTHDGSVDAHAEQLRSAAKRSCIAQTPTEVVISDSPSMSRSLARQSTTPQPARRTFQPGNTGDNGPLFIRNYPARSNKRSSNMISHGDISALEELDLQRALPLSLEIRSTAGARPAKPSKSPKRSGTPEIIDLT
jgi:Holliday junction resolvase YEN1